MTREWLSFLGVAGLWDMINVAGQDELTDHSEEFIKFVGDSVRVQINGHMFTPTTYETKPKRA